MCAWHPQSSEESVKYPGIGVSDGCEPQYR